MTLFSVQNALTTCGVILRNLIAVLVAWLKVSVGWLLSGLINWLSVNHGLLIIDLVGLWIRLLSLIDLWLHNSVLGILCRGFIATDYWIFLVICLLGAIMESEKSGLVKNIKETETNRKKKAANIKSQMTNHQGKGM